MSVMKVRRHGVAAALLIIIALLQMGCGAQSTTSPESVFPNQEPGEVILPDPILATKLPVPVDFKADYYGGCTVFLSWSAPGLPVDAVLSLDGAPMTCQESSCRGYVDLCNKQTGPHTYTLQYTNGVLMGPAETVTVNIDPPVIDGSGGGHEPLPEQGVR